MQRQIYLFFEQFLIIFNPLFINLVNSKPMIGPNVRSAAPGEYPFTVAIEVLNVNSTRQHDYLCTGSLVSREDVITADHCFREQTISGIYVLAESINLQQAKIFYPSWWIGYNDWSIRCGEPLVYLENDITILRLTKEVSKSIAIGEFSFKNPKTFHGNNVMMAGWGTLINGSIPNIMQVAALKLLSLKQCENKVAKIAEKISIETRFLCSKADPPAVIMAGDSGGPLMHNNKIIGINAGSSPLEEPPAHIEKVNLHSSVEFYKYYILDVVNNY